MGKTLEEVIIEALMMEKAREIINPEVKILYQKKKKDHLTEKLN